MKYTIKLILAAAFIGSVLAAYAVCYEGHTDFCMPSSYSTTVTQCTGSPSAAVVIVNNQGVVRCRTWTTGPKYKNTRMPTCYWDGYYIEPCTGNQVFVSDNPTYWDCDPDHSPESCP